MERVIRMSNEKLNYYFKRTTEHIHRVQNNMVKVVTEFRDQLSLTDEDCRGLMHNVMKHDMTKFSVEQFLPYVELTEYYRQRKNLNNPEYKYPSEEIERQVDAAVDHHYKNENHHPERFQGTIGKYDIYEAIETVCDLQAMAQEFNEDNCRMYFEKVWKPKQSRYFYDDYNWVCTITHMDNVIKCFESN